MTGRANKETEGNNLSTLRRYTVFVLLALLIFVTIGNFIDDLFFANQFTTDPAFFALVGGMITGLFSAEAISIWRSGNNKEE
jgi:peptidoglycan/LPS O-acetylase OafA/YrhL